jgi:hypothetical protein
MQRLLELSEKNTLFSMRYELMHSMKIKELPLMEP